MNLTGLFSSSSASETHAFFVIYFAERTVRTALWQVVNGQIEIVTASTDQPWLSDAELIDSTDAAIQELGKESENIRQTLFALEPTWVTQQGILPDKKLLFQQLTKELDLEAVGFVVIPEAIIQDALYHQGAHFECFVVEVMSERVYLTQLKNGKLGQQEMVPRSTNLVEDIAQSFSRFHDSPLPGTMLLYSSLLTPEELQECSRRLMEIDLDGQHAFADPVSIQTLDADHILDIVIQTGGRAVAEARQLIAPLPLPTEPIAIATDNEIVAEDQAEDSFESEEDGDELRELEVAPVEQFLPGAQLDSDFRHEQGSMAPSTTNRLFGFIPHHPVLFSFIGILLGVIILAALFFFSSARLMTAHVTIELKTSQLSKELALRLDPKAVVSDPISGTLKAETLKHSVTGTKEVETTGKKLIGDKAKGKITIFNRTSSPKNLPAGTVVQTDKLKYLLDQAVTVASASTGRNFETNPGTVEATITAAVIGSESNISGDKELTIDSFAKDTYIARTKDAISGGTSREIKAVSQKDHDELMAALKKELNQQAAKELQEKAGEGQYIYPTNTVKVTESKFSAEVGKEINTLSLSLTLEADALSYSAGELQQLATQVMTQDLPAGYALPSDGIEILTQTTPTSSPSAQVNILTQLSAAAKPVVNAEAWKEEIAGQTETAAKEKLQQKPEIAKVQLTRQPAFFAKFISTLPKDSKKITVQVR